VTLLPIHVAAGGLALVLGAVALTVKKGGTIHRRSGLLFVCAMIVMGVTAAALGNVGGGLMAIYFVVTALATVRPLSPWPRGVMCLPSSLKGPSFPLAIAEPDEATMPAFERRALLRDKRHRLVSDLRRSQGGSHAEINRWLNRSCGIRRVEDASIDQLERSIDLLLGRLSGRR